LADLRHFPFLAAQCAGLLEVAVAFLGPAFVFVLQADFEAAQGAVDGLAVLDLDSSSDEVFAAHERAS
jgi:hypothetical protein